VLILATTADFESWTGDIAPENVGAMLREASVLVSDATKADVYDVLPSGLPSDPDLSDALRDATCAQAESWILTGDDPRKGAGGQLARPTTSSIDGASVSYDTYLTAGDRSRALTSLHATAYRILRAAGLASATASLQ
jgi:hypothetical protein